TYRDATYASNSATARTTPTPPDTTSRDPPTNRDQYSRSISRPRDNSNDSAAARNDSSTLNPTDEHATDAYTVNGSSLTVTQGGCGSFDAHEDSNKTATPPSTPAYIEPDVYDDVFWLRAAISYRPGGISVKTTGS